MQICIAEAVKSLTELIGRTDNAVLQQCNLWIFLTLSYQSIINPWNLDPQTPPRRPFLNIAEKKLGHPQKGHFFTCGEIAL